MLCRFGTAEELAAWETSPQRSWWLASAQGLARMTRTERRTGIEGWFDEPTSRDVQDPRPQQPAPPRWKQATVIWLTFFPLSTLLGVLYVLGTGGDLGWGLVVRTAVTTLAATPIMVYALLPWMTRRFAWWLHR